MKRIARLGAQEKMVLTANRLLDGRIVWRDGNGRWREAIGSARQLDGPEVELALQQAQEAAQAEGVIGIYEVVVRAGEKPEPVSMRERIRAYGPSVHPEFSGGWAR